MQRPTFRTYPNGARRVLDPARYLAKTGRTLRDLCTCGSWVIVQRTTRDVVREVWSREVADRIAKTEPNFEVLTAAQWLAEFNRRVNGA